MLAIYQREVQPSRHQSILSGWATPWARYKSFEVGPLVDVPSSGCAPRLQTVDYGAPESTYTVARKIGHGGEAMVRRVYGHLGQVRQTIGHLPQIATRVLTWEECPPRQIEGA